jgi:hypothetical protein
VPPSTFKAKLKGLRGSRFPMHLIHLWQPLLRVVASTSRCKDDARAAGISSLLNHPTKSPSTGGIQQRQRTKTRLDYTLEMVSHLQYQLILTSTLPLQGYEKRVRSMEVNGLAPSSSQRKYPR